MKRTCNKCRALSSWKYLFCMFGYKTKPKYYKGVVIGLIPLENCPKPTTYKQFLHDKNKNRMG